MMKNKQKSNPWKTATLMMLLLFMGLIAASLWSKQQTMDIQGFEISEKDFELFGRLMVDEGKTEMRICNIDTGICILIKAEKGE